MSTIEATLFLMKNLKEEDQKEYEENQRKEKIAAPKQKQSELKNTRHTNETKLL